MSHIPPDDSLSTIEAPEPGWVLDGNMQIADDNQDAIELYNQVGNPRAILNKKELKQYKNQLNKIDAYLKKHQLVDLITQYDVLKSDYQGLVAQRYELIKEREYGEREDKYILSDLAILKQNARSIRKDYKQLEARLMPHRKMIILQRTIQARIDEHVQALKDEEINRRNRLLLNKEANAIGSIIIKIMNGLDFCFRTTHKGKERIVSIKFGRVIVTPETIQYQVLLSESGLFGGSIIHVPRGVDLVSAMNKSSVLQQASAATRMVVTCPQSESGRWHEGIWIFVHRNNFMDGLKEKVWFRDYIKRYPEDDKDLIPLPAGLKEGMWASWTNLAQQPHIIITGQNGSGKSNAMLTWITTLITKHSPDEIRLVLVDLKEGVDFHGFKGIPHLLGDVIEDAAAASEILVALERLRASRMNELKLAGERNINNFNRRHPSRKMPHIAVFVDEFGAFASGANREFSKTVYNVAAQLAMKARAAGIHLIIGAQTPSKHHIPTDVRDNITFKLLGKQGSMYGAIVAGGTKAAFDLPKIAGRFIVQDGADSYPCQLPFISDDEIDAGITTAMTWGKPTIDIPFVSDVLSGDISFYTPLASSKQIYTTDVFIKTCLNDLGGSINYRGAWEIAKSEYDVSLSQVQAIAEELKLSEMLEFEGATYQLVTQGRGKRLEKVEIMENKTSDIYPEGELAMNNEVEL